MIEPRCLIKEHGRPCLLRDDFAVGENDFMGPARGPAWRRSMTKRNRQRLADHARRLRR